MRVLVLIYALFISTTAIATIHRIKVSNFQFSPRRVNAVTGDTLLWIYKNGFHTTTSTSIPQGALPWDSPMDVNTTRFGYQVTVAGVYNYFCLYHAAEMKGVIRVFPAAIDSMITDFSVSPDDDGLVRLSWNMTYDKSIGSVSLLRSFNGEDFKVIQNISFRKYSGVINYHVSDSDTTQGFRYYLLEFTDAGQNIFQTKIIEFKYKKPTRLIYSISPNPLTSPHLLLTFSAMQEGKMKVILQDARGVVVARQLMTAEKGINTGHLHLGNIKMRTGVYYLTCSMGSLKEKYTLVKP